MKSKGLTSGDYNLKKSERSLNDSFLKAQEIFLPVLQKKTREDTIKKNLAIMEKYSLIFGLGQRIETSMILGDYSKAVQDYKQAKLSLKNAIERDAKTGSILEKIWKSHEEGSIKSLIEKLLSRLTSPMFSFDIHEKIIELLLQMDSRTDPINIYFQSRKKTLLDSIQTASLQTTNDIKELDEDVNSAQVFSSILSLLQTGMGDSIIPSSHYACVRSWRRREGFFRILRELSSDFFPSFGKFLSIVNGQQKWPNSKIDEYKITGFADEFYATMSSCMKMMLDLELITDNIKDCAIPNALSSCKVIDHLKEIVNIIRESQMHLVFMERADQLLQEITREIIQSIWKCSKRDILDLYLMEDWKYNPLGLSTGLIQSFEVFLFFILDSVKAISPHAALDKLSFELISCFIDSLVGLVEFTEAKRAGDQPQSLSIPTTATINQESSKPFSSLPLNSQHSQNSNNNNNVSAVNGIENERKEQRKKSKNKSGGNNNNNATGNSSHAVSSLSSSFQRIGLGYRLLIMIANVTFMNNRFPSRLKDKYRISDSGPTRKIMEKTIKKARDQYLSCNISRLSLIIENGFFTELDSNLPPRDLRPYLYNVLLQMISIQTEICDISPNLLRSLISEILLALLRHIYDLLEGVGVGTHVNASSGASQTTPSSSIHLTFNGYLQLKLEIDYLQQRMVTCIESEGQELIAKINVSIERRVKEEMPTQRDIREIIESKLDNIMNKTILQFSCFQYT